MEKEIKITIEVDKAGLTCYEDTKCKVTKTIQVRPNDVTIGSDRRNEDRNDPTVRFLVGQVEGAIIGAIVEYNKNVDAESAGGGETSDESNGTDQ